MVFYFLANIFTYQLFWCFFFVNDFYLQQWGREGLGLDFVDWRIVVSEWLFLPCWWVRDPREIDGQKLREVSVG